MINELLWVILLLVNFSLVLAAYRLWGKTGLYVWTGFAIVLANIQVLKTIELFGVVATLGNVLFGSLFLVTDILTEKYGKAAAKKAVWIGFFSMFAGTFIMWLSIHFVPHSSDFAQSSLEMIFGILPRIGIASITAYLISSLHDIWAYALWKEKWHKTWLSNNLSTMVSQLIDSVVFCFIAFWGLFPVEVFWQILITTYLIKWVVAVADTPFIYLAKRMNNHSPENPD